MLLPILFFLLTAMLPLGQLDIPTLNIVTPEQQKQIIDKFNSVRREVHPPARNMLEMKWNEKAAENIRKWIAQCKFGATPLRARFVNGFYCGETISQATVANSWTDIIELWTNQKPKFKNNMESKKQKNNTYTYNQTIWYNSHEVGCAVAYCPQSAFRYFYGCQYCPGGNIVGEKPYKEGRPCEDCPDSCNNKLCTNPCTYFNKYHDCDGVAQFFRCNMKWMQKYCKATCECKTEII